MGASRALGILTSDQTSNHASTSQRASPCASHVTHLFVPICVSHTHTLPVCPSVCHALRKSPDASHAPWHRVPTVCVRLDEPAASCPWALPPSTPCFPQALQLASHWHLPQLRSSRDGHELKHKAAGLALLLSGRPSGVVLQQIYSYIYPTHVVSPDLLYPVANKSTPTVPSWNHSTPANSKFIP
jgi:hypothetical protein